MQVPLPSPSTGHVTGHNVRISDGTKSTIIDIFGAIKTLTGRSFKDLKVCPIGSKILPTNTKTVLARKLVVMMFIHYRINPILLCYYFNTSTQEVDRIWHEARKDKFVLKELELAKAITSGSTIRALTPLDGVNAFKLNSNQWFGKLLTLEQLADLLVYVEGTLIGTAMRHDRLAAVRALHLLAITPELRHTFINYLSLSGLCNYAGLVEYQVRNAGYKMVC